MKKLLLLTAVTFFILCVRGWGSPGALPVEPVQCNASPVPTCVPWPTPGPQFTPVPQFTQEPQLTAVPQFTAAVQYTPVPQFTAAIQFTPPPYLTAVPAATVQQVISVGTQTPTATPNPTQAAAMIATVQTELNQGIPVYPTGTWPTGGASSFGGGVYPTATFAVQVNDAIAVYPTGTWPTGGAGSFGGGVYPTATFAVQVSNAIAVYPTGTWPTGGASAFGGGVYPTATFAVLSSQGTSPWIMANASPTPQLNVNGFIQNQFTPVPQLTAAFPYPTTQISLDSGIETPVFGLNSKAVTVDTGHVTISTALPAGANTIGGVSMIGPIAAGSNAIGGVSVLAPVTVTGGVTQITNPWIVAYATPTFTPTVTPTGSFTPTPTFTGSATPTQTFTQTPINVSQVNPPTPDQTKLAGKDIQLTQVFIQQMLTVTPNATPSQAYLDWIQNWATPNATQVAGKDLQLTQVSIELTSYPAPLYWTPTPTPTPNAAANNYQRVSELAVETQVAAQLTTVAAQLTQIAGLNAKAVTVDTGHVTVINPPDPGHLPRLRAL